MFKIITQIIVKWREQYRRADSQHGHKQKKDGIIITGELMEIILQSSAEACKDENEKQNEGGDRFRYSEKKFCVAVFFCL